MDNVFYPLTTVDSLSFSSTVDDQPNPKSPMSHSSLVPSFSQHTSHMSQSTQPGPPPLNTQVRPNLQLNIQPNF